MRFYWILLAVLLAAPAWGQSSWPAGKVVFDDAEDLQTKLDEGDLGGGSVDLEDQGSGGTSSQGFIADGIGGVDLVDIATEAELGAAISGVPTSCTSVPEGSDGDVQVNDSGVLGSVSGIQTLSASVGFMNASNILKTGSGTNHYWANTSTSSWTLTSLSCRLGNVSVAVTSAAVTPGVSDTDFTNAVVPDFSIAFASETSNTVLTDSTCTTNCSVAPGQIVGLSAYFTAGNTSQILCTYTYTVDAD